MFWAGILHKHTFSSIKFILENRALQTVLRIRTRDPVLYWLLDPEQVFRIPDPTHNRLEWAEKEIEVIQDGGQTKREKDI